MSMTKLSLFVVLLQLVGCNVKESSHSIVDERHVVADVTSTIHNIFAACKNKSFTELESYHINTSKFSIFREDGSRERLDASKNNEIIRSELSSLENAKFDISDLKIDVVRHTVVATFILEIHASMQNTPVSGSNRATFVFVEDQGSWKVLHEHFSAVVEKPH